MQQTNNQQIIRTLKMLKNLRPAQIFEHFENFYIILIINILSFCQNFRLFTVGKRIAPSVKFTFWTKISFCQIGNCCFSVLFCSFKPMYSNSVLARNVNNMVHQELYTIRNLILF